MYVGCFKHTKLGMNILYNQNMVRIFSSVPDLSSEVFRLLYCTKLGYNKIQIIRINDPATLYSKEIQASFRKAASIASALANPFEIL